MELKHHFFKFVIPRKTRTSIDARILQCVIADGPALATDIQLVDLLGSSMALFSIHKSSSKEVLQ